MVLEEGAVTFLDDLAAPQPHDTRQDKRGCLPCRAKLLEGMKAMMQTKPRRLVLTNWQSPGDIVMMTAAVRDLHRAYPERFLTHVVTSCGELWQSNPYISTFPEPWIGEEAQKARDERPLAVRKREDVTTIPMTYAITDKHHFTMDFHRCLEAALGAPVPITESRGDLYLSNDEKAWINQVQEIGVHDKFWLINAGGKWDFTAKWPNWMMLQSVVEHFMGHILFVQIGDRGNWQPELRNTIDFVGQTDLRMLLRLIYHAEGIITPLNGIMHFAAAVPLKHPERKIRPCVVLAGGREHMHWEAYPWHRYVGLEGALPCCAPGGCDKPRATASEDGDDKDGDANRCHNYREFDAPKYAGKNAEGRPASFPEVHNLYLKARGKQPSQNNRVRIAKCQMMIHAEDVIRAIEAYYEGGLLSWV